MKKVLVAEDEASIREFIVINLKRSGYEVSQADNGRAALEIYEAADGDFDVVLLDIMMPEMDGLEVCKKLRSMSQTVGIIMLTAKTQEIDRVTGLLVGADDYVTKPFSPSELMARVDAIYRRVEMNKNREEPQKSIIELGEFVLNLRDHTLKKNEELIELTQVEFQIIEYFFTNEGAALSRTDILNRVWGKKYFGEEKVVDVNIRRLRMKVEDEPSNPRHLVTVWGLGYKWVI
ncbi:MAG: response regulator transcription factor [Clostridia bacterium]|nr:response regulator transcription factor [Clostridia bacterium]